MTVAASTSRADYTGNGVTTAFAVPFRFLDNSHLKVIKTSTIGIATTLALTTDYTVSGAGGVSGTVTCLVAPASGEKLSILRSVPLTQATDYVANDPFPAESHEAALDKLTMIAQQHEEALNRALTLAPNASGVSATLPSAEANKVVAWNSSGTALVNVTAAELSSALIGANTIIDTFTGNGSDVNFTLTAAPQALNNTIVTIGGVVQDTTEYSVAGSVITFNTAPPNGVVFQVRQQVSVTYPITSLLPNAVTTPALADGAVTLGKITMNTGKLLGRTTASSGSPEEIAVAGSLTFSGGVLTGTAYTGTSMVRVSNANGYGSTNTCIRRFSNVITNQGSDITYADSATLGASFTINTAGVYSVSFTESLVNSDYFGVSVNTTQPATNVSGISPAERIALSCTSAADTPGTCGNVCFLQAGSVVRAHNTGAATGLQAVLCQFTICRVA